MDGVCQRVVDGVPLYGDTCHKSRHTCQYIWTFEATSSCERPTPTFSICHNVRQSWCRDRGKQSVNRGLLNLGHRFCHGNTEDLEIATTQMTEQNGQTFSKAPSLP